MAEDAGNGETGGSGGDSAEAGSGASGVGGGESANTDPNSSVESDAARSGAFGPVGPSGAEGIVGADQAGFIGGEPVGAPPGAPSRSDGVTTSFRELAERVVQGRISTPDAVLSGFLATLTAAIPGAGLLGMAVGAARERGYASEPPSFGPDVGGSGGLTDHWLPPVARPVPPSVPGVPPADFLPPGTPYEAPQPWVPTEADEALAESLASDAAPAAVADQPALSWWPAVAAAGLFFLAASDG